MSTNLDDFLPAIFRRKLQPQMPPNADQPIDDSPNYLAPQPSDRANAPASVQPIVPVTDMATAPNIAAPVDPTAGSVGDYSGGTGTTRARRVETDEKGRPIANTTMAGDAQVLDLNQRVHSYHPQAAQGWWDKWGKQMVHGAISGLRYGVGGALGGAISGGVRGATNPELGDEQWKQGEIDNTDPEVQRIAQTQQMRTKAAQAALQAQNTQANTAHTQADTDRLKAQAAEQERDNLRQLYNSLPDFDRKNPQHKAIADRAASLGLVLPDREAKDETTIEKVNGRLLAVNRKTRTATPITQDGQALVNQADVPTKVTIGGEEFTVTQAQGASALATQGQQQYQRTKDTETTNAERQAAEQRAKAADDAANLQLSQKGVATDRANALRAQLGTLPRSDPSRAEITAQIRSLESEAAYHQREADSALRERDTQRAGATKYTRGSQSVAPQSSRPGKIQPNEDGHVRAYANQYFRGDYNAAQRAIEAQRQKR